MNLREAVERLDTLNDNDVIYAEQPWTETSRARILQIDDNGDLLPGSDPCGSAYFLGIGTAREVLEVFGDRTPSADEKFACLLYYAINDAFPDWAYGS